MISDGQKQTIILRFKNHKKEILEHKVIPKRIFYGKNPFIKERQWVLTAFNLEKKANRDYAMASIVEWVPMRLEE